jgi:RimJ/RimL family protein N-acetyltransferase
MALVLGGIAVIVLPGSPLAWRPMRIARDEDDADEGPELSMWPATRDDARGVIDLIGRVYAEYSFVYDPRVEVPDLLRFEEHYEAPRGAFFVVRENDRIVGSVGIERVDGETAELHRLYLDARLRGRGTGRALVQAALAWCRGERGITRLILWSDTRFEQAHRLYTRMGFRRTGERTLPDDLNQTREYGFERPV